MAGVTSTISIEQFRIDWRDNKPISLLCEMYSVTKDQVIRLRDVWQLPLRNDRRLRHKPVRQADPTPQQIRAACAKFQARWDDHTREARRVTKSQPLEVRHVSVSSIVLHDLDSDE